MDFPGRVIAAFIAVILILLFPLQYIAKASENNIDYHISDCTEQFTDDIRNKGYLDTASYESYIKKLDASGELYDLEIEDIHPVTGEAFALYEDGDDVSLTSNDNDADLYKSHNNTLHLSSNNLEINRNNSILLAMNESMGNADLSFPGINQRDEIQSFATHIHTDDCYVGHAHDYSNCYMILMNSVNYFKGQKVTYDFRLFTENSSETYSEGIEVICPVCGSKLAEVKYTYFSSYNQKTFMTQTVNNNYYTYDHGGGYDNLAYKDQVYSIRQSVLNGDSDDIIIKKLIYLGFIPNATCYCQANCTGAPTFVSYYAGQRIFLCEKAEQPLTLLCDQVVTSITPTNPTQTVKKGEGIIATAYATYLDGHVGVVNCSSSFNPNINGTQTVTLTYSGLVGNAKTTGTRTCTMSVTVITKTLQYITATPASQVVARYRAMPLSVTAHYSDGSSSLLSAGQYTLSHYDTSLIGGPQTITVSYSEGGNTKTTTVTLYVDTVASITVTPNDLSVYKYTESIPVNIIANYYYSGSKVLSEGVSVTGYSPGFVGDQIVTFYYTEGGVTVSANAVVHVVPLYKICSTCGNLYHMNTDDTDPGCPYCSDLITGIEVSPKDVVVLQGENLPITVKAIYKNEVSKTVSGWSSDLNKNKIGLQLVTVRYGAFEETIYVTVKEKGILCPTCGNTYLPSKGSCPVCKEKVVGISVAPGALTVEQYGSIDLNVVATYADGSTRSVTDWSIDCTTARPGVYKALVTYHNYSVEIALTVLSQFMVICPYCHNPYDRGEHPEGCPVCFYTMTGIEAFPANGSGLVQLGGTPDISVVLVFKDTHREIAKNGFTVEGFQSSKLGPQTITIRFKGFSCTLVLEVVDAVKSIVCPKGHIYYPNEDGTDTGCPFCVMATGHLTVYYYDITYLSEILEIMYAEGVYRFEKGNYLTVRATKRDISLVSKLQKMFFQLALLGRKRRFTFGGEVG